MKKNIYLITTFLILCLGIYFVQNVLDREIEERTDIEFMYLPDGRVLKKALKGFENLAADIYWIRGVLYFGRNNFDEDYPFQIPEIYSKKEREKKEINWGEKKKKLELLNNILNIVIELDPYFLYPYLFGGLFLSMKLGEPNEAIGILRKGEKIFPTDWRFPFWIGFNYFFYLGDTESSLKEFLRAMALPGCRSYVNDIARGIIENEGKKEIAVNFLKGARDSAQNKIVKKQFDKILKEIDQKY